MPTSYTSLIGLALPQTGELSGTWGDTVNDYITRYLDAAIAGAQTISGNQTAVTLSTTNGSTLVSAGAGATGSAQYSIINCTGNPAATLVVTVPTASKVYLVLNATSTSQSVTVKPSGAAGITVAAGRAALIAWNGSDFVRVATNDLGALTGTISLTANVTGTLPVANGGTGAATLTANNVLVGNGTSAVGFVAPGASGNVLTSNGTAWTSAAVIPAGTAMLFAQTAAPTGWTKSTTHDNKALRVVSGAASSGGSVAFTTAFASQSVSGTVGSTTLTSAQIPAHTHTYDQAQATSANAGISKPISIYFGGNASTNTGSTGGGGSHNHSFTGTAINLAVQYVDVIIATKD